MIARAIMTAADKVMERTSAPLGGKDRNVSSLSRLCRVAWCCSSLVTAGFRARAAARRVELFTSQGCSSCPAADRLLGELAKDTSLVAISVPIDYWDYLGWKDTLADPRHTARQKAYAHARGDGQVYTPQVVVNGSLHVLGSDKSAIDQAINKSRKNGAMALPPVTLAVADGRVNIDVPDGDRGSRARKSGFAG